ncbi:MAG: nucleoside hydrolase [Thermomicrobiales bacterium]
MPPVRVVLDTDIGTDVDDCLALAFLLGSPEIQLDAITTVYADVALRARMTRKLLSLRGGDAARIPVYEGISAPLLGLEPIYWPGHEGVGLLDADEDARFAAGPDQHAVDFLVDHVLAHPGEIHLLAIGPLTNVAAAITREPRFAASLKHLTIMGGWFAVTPTSSRGPAEHNIICDPEAAHIVLSSEAPMSLVPLDVTLRALIDQSGVEALRAKGTPYHDAVAQQLADYPGFVARGGNTFLHDPLAAATLVRPEILHWTDLAVRVELNGTFTTAMTVGFPPSDDRPATARVALDLDRAASEAFIAERIAG